MNRSFLSPAPPTLSGYSNLTRSHQHIHMKAVFSSEIPRESAWKLRNKGNFAEGAGTQKGISLTLPAFGSEGWIFSPQMEELLW